jgi:hypothetical protein
MIDAHVRLDPSLAEHARQAAGVGPVSVAALVRYALARLANWPDEAARTIARIPGDAGPQQRQPQAGA